MCYIESMKNREKKTYFQRNGIVIYLVANRRLLAYALLWGIPFAVSCVLGWRLAHEGTVFGPGGSAAAYMGSFLKFLLETAALSVPAAVLAALALRGSSRSFDGSHESLGGSRRAFGGSRKSLERRRGEAGGRAAFGKVTVTAGTGSEKPEKIWLFYSLLIFLCWLPVFLAYYPSVFAYDAEGQLYQVIAKDYNTHHPLLHTLFLGTFFRLGGAVGSYQTGMAVHSVVQMLLMALAFGRALSWLYERRTPRWIRLLLLFFYGLFPTNSILSLSTTKDVLFSALVLLFTLKSYRLVSGCGRETPGVGAGDRAAFIVLAVLMLLFRNNAVYAFAVSVPFVAVGLREQKRRTESGVQETEARSGKRRRKWFLAAAVLLLYGICAFMLKAVTHAQSGSPREMLSVPLQQMARVRVAAEERIEPAMRQELDKYIPAEWVFAAYDPHLADPVKNRAVIHDDPAGLVRAWIWLGLRFPTIYVDAFLDNSLGLWYLWDTSHAKIYGIGTESGFGYLSTDNRTMPAGCEIVERSFLPGLRAFLERIVSDNVYQKLPFIRLLFAPALYWWLLWLYLTAALYRGKKREALPAVFLIAYYLTLLLSPTVIVRYLYPLIVTVPVIFSCISTWDPDRKQENIQ